MNGWTTATGRGCLCFWLRAWVLMDGCMNGEADGWMDDGLTGWSGVEWSGGSVCPVGLVS